MKFSVRSAKFRSDREDANTSEPKHRSGQGRIRRRVISGLTSE